MFRRYGLMPFVLALSAGMGAVAVSAQQPAIIRDELAMLEAVERERLALPPGRKEPRYRRSRGAQAKPRKHRNRTTVSRRTRRKHRRAA